MDDERAATDTEPRCSTAPYRSIPLWQPEHQGDYRDRVWNPSAPSVAAAGVSRLLQRPLPRPGAGRDFGACHRLRMSRRELSRHAPLGVESGAGFERKMTVVAAGAVTDSFVVPLE